MYRSDFVLLYRALLLDHLHLPLIIPDDAISDVLELLEETILREACGLRQARQDRHGGCSATLDPTTVLLELSGCLER